MSRARENSRSPLCLSRFKELPTDQASRASYFCELAKVIDDLGVGNPHEKAALSIEPTHPVLSADIANTIDTLDIGHALGSTYVPNKLSLISMPMLDFYAPNSDAEKILRSPYKAPLHLLDPLYGFAFFRDKAGVHNHCFALDIWSSHLASMPPPLAEFLWKSSRADNMLSGGALAGRLLFKDVLSPARDGVERSTVAEICVSSEAELLELVGRLKAHAESHHSVQLWFRGQREEFRTPERSKIAGMGIAPYSNIQESDLTPSLYRKYDSYPDSLDLFEDVVIELAEWVHWAKHVAQESLGNELPTRNQGVASVEKGGLSAYQRGLVLQQYGAPSAFLDITRDCSIAAWFATRSCSFNSEGRMDMREYLWSGSNSQNWPTIFVFPLVSGVHPFLDLSAILGETQALRPERQKCGLLGGAGNLARNYCARYVGLKIRLKPGFKLTNPAAAADLFPPASEDTTLAFLRDKGLGDSGRRFALSELA
jgi:hypothetical protein